MSGGKNKQKPLGYTIVEVMIVLAVSGVMFLIAANFINGKQQKTSFNQGVNEMASRIQDTIEQVTDGQYSDIPISCTPGTPVQVSYDPTKTQGDNPSCVFIGKMLQFSSSNKASYQVFSLVASRSATSLGPDVNVADALTTQQTVPQNLDVSAVTVNGAAAPGNSFGFTQSQGTTDPTTGNYVDGAQTVGLVYATSTSIPQHVATATSASFCLSDGAYYAHVNIGGSDSGGNQLGIHVKMQGKDNTGC